jgi:hypothetical protein
VSYRVGELPSGSAGLGQMDFQKGSVATSDSAKRMQSLDDSCAPCPAAADPSGKRHHGNLPSADRCRAQRRLLLAPLPGHLPAVGQLDIFDRSPLWQTVLSDSDSTCQKSCPNLFVLLPIKAVRPQKFLQRLGGHMGNISLRQQAF